MYGPGPICFSAHWCADYSKYRAFLAGGISTASSLRPFFGTRLRRQNLNPAPTQYRQLRRLQSALSKETTRLEPQTSRSLIFIIANTNSTLSSLIIEVTRATANIKVYDYSLKFCW